MALFRLVGVARLRRTELIWLRSRRWPLATGSCVLLVAWHLVIPSRTSWRIMRSLTLLLAGPLALAGLLG